MKKSQRIKLITWSLFGANLFLTIFYLAMVNSAIWNVVGRQDKEKSIKQITTDLAALESTYVALNSKISLSNAAELGFKSTSSSDTVFVNRSTFLGMR